MRFRDGFDLVALAYKNKDKDKWFKTWLVQQPNDGQYIIGFDEWYKQLVKTNEKLNKAKAMSDEDILLSAKKIRERLAK